MLKLMRAPAKYVQGEDALLELRQNVENLGKSFLFICSGSGRKATEDKIRQSFASSEAQIYFETFGGISSRPVRLYTLALFVCETEHFVDAHLPCLGIQALAA